MVQAKLLKSSSLALRAVAIRTRFSDHYRRLRASERLVEWIADISRYNERENRDPNERRILNLRYATTVVSAKPQFQGFNCFTGILLKSDELRVTSVKSWAIAVAAMSASRSERGSGTCNLVHCRATFRSTGRIRVWNVARTFFSVHVLTTLPEDLSRRSSSNIPSSSSRMEIADTKSSDGSTASAHFATPGFVRSRRRRSDSTFVSSRYITQIWRA